MAELEPGVPIGIVGAGTMGGGIAQVAALAGHPVRIFDSIPGTAEEAIATIRTRLARLTEKHRIDPHVALEASERLGVAGSIFELRGCALIVEAVAEDAAIKRELFTMLETLCGPDTILASNTSSLSISDIAAELEHPERVAGMHFFNPAPLLPLVEIVSGEATDPAVTDTLARAAKAWGKTPVKCTSTPGFIVNRVARPFYAEAFRLLSAGSIDPVTLDALARESGGFQMGPCELTDLIGQDVNAAVTRSIWEAFDRDPRFEPSELQDAMVRAGRLGQKAGRGFYESTFRPDPATAKPFPRPGRVTANGSGGLLEVLSDRLERAGVAVLRSRDAGPVRIRPAEGVTMQLTDGRTAAEVTDEAGEPTFLIDLAHDFDTATRFGLAAPAGAPGPALEAAGGCLQAAGAKVTIVADKPGMVIARTVAMLAAFGAEAVESGVATALDVDTAMRLGVNYPSGPIEWGASLGWSWVAGVLEALASAEDALRYRVPDAVAAAAMREQSQAASHG